MGDTIWIDVEGRRKEDVPHDNSIILRLSNELDQMADKLNVARLSSFYDHGVVQAELKALLEDAGEFTDQLKALLPSQPKKGKKQWCDPAQPLASVRAIREHLVQHPEDLGFQPTKRQQHWPESLMNELKHCEDVLEDAATRGRKIRFLIVQ